MVTTQTLRTAPALRPAATPVPRPARHSPTAASRGRAQSEAGDAGPRATHANFCSFSQ